MYTLERTAIHLEPHGAGEHFPKSWMSIGRDNLAVHYATLSAIDRHRREKSGLPVRRTSQAFRRTPDAHGRGGRDEVGKWQTSARAQVVSRGSIHLVVLLQLLALV